MYWKNRWKIYKHITIIKNTFFSPAYSVRHDTSDLTAFDYTVGRNQTALFLFLLLVFDDRPTCLTLRFYATTGRFHRRSFLSDKVVFGTLQIGKCRCMRRRTRREKGNNNVDEKRIEKHHLRRVTNVVELRTRSETERGTVSVARAQNVGPEFDSRPWKTSPLSSVDIVLQTRPCRAHVCFDVQHSRRVERLTTNGRR